ncbi:MAG: hypothetical protein RIQ99_1564 [Pseudomonadota bacterium]|jgi:hypothetical protein
MHYFANVVGAAIPDVEALPWIPFLPYSDQLGLKIIRAANGIAPVDITSFAGN